MIITEMILRCSACPTQYSIKLEDGRMAYFRYRWGYLSILVSAGPTDDIFAAVGGQEVFGEQISDDMDGYMPLEVAEKYLTEAGFIL